MELTGKDVERIDELENEAWSFINSLNDIPKEDERAADKMEESSATLADVFLATWEEEDTDGPAEQEPHVPDCAEELIKAADRVMGWYCSNGSSAAGKSEKRYAAYLDEDGDLEWDMEYIGEFVDEVLGILFHHGVEKVWYPYETEDEKGYPIVEQYEYAV